MGHIGTSSFYPPHHITTGEGGAVYRMSTWGRARHFLKKEARA
ncbi:MAG TPA: DegT/DnrJ/EryC1/StrS family aminotransferase [Candidatus Omnitrophota bacterium]|nr:DegT/DnrJ/EryC1/StrS family aminotransferase [Candidatus Omnitrophota bacterium]HPS36816.1 DegT/DnrJ/EryC1/StrS family aminotransferase [Candidatus Omnitrophota bacterium]